MELAMEKIMSISQEGTIHDYCEAFEILFNLLKTSEEISEYYAIYLFINGLEQEIRDVFMTWHQYSFHTLKDVISLALKLDANELKDSFSPYDPNSSLYDAFKIFDVNDSLENGRVIDNDAVRENRNNSKTASKVFDERREGCLMTLNPFVLTSKIEVLDCIEKLENHSKQLKVNQTKEWEQINHGHGVIQDDMVPIDLFQVTKTCDKIESCDGIKEAITAKDVGSNIYKWDSMIEHETFAKRLYAWHKWKSKLGFNPKFYPFPCKKFFVGMGIRIAVKLLVLSSGSPLASTKFAVSGDSGVGPAVAYETKHNSARKIGLMPTNYHFHLIPLALVGRMKVKEVIELLLKCWYNGNINLLKMQPIWFFNFVGVEPFLSFPLIDFTTVPAIINLLCMNVDINTIGGDYKKINPSVQVNVVTNYLGQVDVARSENVQANMKLKLQCCNVRFAFLEWGSHAFKNMLVVLLVPWFTKRNLGQLHFGCHQSLILYLYYLRCPLDEDVNDVNIIMKVYHAASIAYCFSYVLWAFKAKNLVSFVCNCRLVKRVVNISVLQHCIQVSTHQTTCCDCIVFVVSSGHAYCRYQWPKAMAAFIILLANYIARGSEIWIRKWCFNDTSMDLVYPTVKKCGLVGLFIEFLVMETKEQTCHLTMVLFEILSTKKKSRLCQKKQLQLYFSPYFLILEVKNL